MVEEVGRRRLDYDTDLVKHYVRLVGWLPAIRHRAARVGERNLRYLTFCAAKAIDVFLLEMEDLISRDPETGRLIDIYYCEREAEDFASIATLIGSAAQGFLGDFADIVLFQTPPELENANLDELDHLPRDSIRRHQLHLKDSNNRLRDAFPFDVINLDVSGVLFPPNDPPVSRLFNSIRIVLDWQSDAMLNGVPLTEFTLFVTSRVASEEMHPEALDMLEEILERNIELHEMYREEFLRKYPVGTARGLRQAEFEDFFVSGVCKVIIDEAIRRNWNPEFRYVFLYRRPLAGDPAFYIVSTVLQLQRFQQVENQLQNPEGAFGEVAANRYFEESTETLQHSPFRVDSQTIDDYGVENLSEHLADVVRFRENSRSQLFGEE